MKNRAHRSVFAMVKRVPPETRLPAVLLAGALLTVACGAIDRPGEITWNIWDSGPLVCGPLVLEPWGNFACPGTEVRIAARFCETAPVTLSLLDFRDEGVVLWEQTFAASREVDATFSAPLATGTYPVRLRSGRSMMEPGLTVQKCD